MLPTERVIFGIPGTGFFGILILLAVVAFVYSAGRRVRVLLALAPENRFDRIGTRLSKTLEYAVAQKRMFPDLYARIFHNFIFTGFLVLLVPTIPLIAQVLVPLVLLLTVP